MDPASEKSPSSPETAADSPSIALPPALALTSSMTLSTLLRQLPPSKEVLEFYQKKLESFEREERRWLRRLSELSKSGSSMVSLQKEKAALSGENAAMRRAVVDMQSAILQERKRAEKLQLQNDRLKIQEMESRKKILLLLEICGRTDSEITKTLNRATRDAQDSGRPDSAGANAANPAGAASLGAGGDSRARDDVFVPERIKRLMEQHAKLKSLKGAPPSKRTLESYELQVASLEHHVLEQERLHAEQISALENERRVADRKSQDASQPFQEATKELARHIGSLEHQLCLVTKDLAASRSEFRRGERAWAAERDTLHRKLQLLQHVGASGHVVAGPGFHTEAQAAKRIAGDANTHRHIQKLNSELAEQKNVASSYRAQLLSVEAEMESLRQQADASQDALKRRTKAMCDHVEKLKARYSELEERKRGEASGYAADVKMLNDKLRHIEHKMLRAAIATAKEHEYIRKIKSQEKELETMKRHLKQNPTWIE